MLNDTDVQLLIEAISKAIDEDNHEQVGTHLIELIFLCFHSGQDAEQTTKILADNGLHSDDGAFKKFIEEHYEKFLEIKKEQK